MTRPTRQREQDADRTRWQGAREEDTTEETDDIEPRPNG
jgi:transcription initiation factor TFIIB